MHLPASALPGAPSLLLDPAGQQLAGRAFSPRPSGFARPPGFEQDFVTPTLLNGWLNYGGAFQSPGYMRDSSGFVHLRGMMRDGSLAPAAAFVLPVGFRPQATEIFTVVAVNAFGRLDVLADGTVYLVTGAVSFVSLAGITFKAV